MEEQNAAILSSRLFPSLQAMLLPTTLTGTEKSTQPPVHLTVSKWRVKTTIQHLRSKGVLWTDCLATALGFPSNSENVCKE